MDEDKVFFTVDKGAQENVSNCLASVVRQKKEKQAKIAELNQSYINQAQIYTSKKTPIHFAIIFCFCLYLEGIMSSSSALNHMQILCGVLGSFLWRGTTNVFFYSAPRVHFLVLMKLLVCFPASALCLVVALY